MSFLESNFPTLLLGLLLKKDQMDFATSIKASQAEENLNIIESLNVAHGRRQVSVGRDMPSEAGVMCQKCLGIL